MPKPIERYDVSIVETIQTKMKVWARTKPEALKIARGKAEGKLEVVSKKTIKKRMYYAANSEQTYTYGDTFIVKGNKIGLLTKSQQVDDKGNIRGFWKMYEKDTFNPIGQGFFSNKNSFRIKELRKKFKFKINLIITEENNEVNKSVSSNPPNNQKAP
jgi:hypothetical protein